MRFYNSGKYTHHLGRDKSTGEDVLREKDLQPKGHEVGTAIVNLHGFKQVVKAGQWVDIPDGMIQLDENRPSPYDPETGQQMTREQERVKALVTIVKNACPSLLTESEVAAAEKKTASEEPKAKDLAPKPVKGKE